MAKKKKTRKRTRPSLTALLAFVVAPVATFLIGARDPGFLGGTGLQQRLKWGMSALLISYFGYDLNRNLFDARWLVQGWLPVIGFIIVRKIKVNRMIGRNSPVIL